VRRYLQAVDEGAAQGWHTLVYGLTLALYSLPVRQGLMNYAQRMLGGFVHASARSLRLSETDCRVLVQDLCADMPRSWEPMLAAETISASRD
jgi:urease accessory protein UreF